LFQPNGVIAWPIRLLIFFGTLLIGITISSAVILIFNVRNRALVDNERELKNIALILAEQTDRAFQALELVQTSVIENIKARDINSSEDYEQKMSGHDIHIILKNKISGLVHVDAVTMINANGKLINFSRYWPIPSVNVADRDYFRALQSDRSLSSFVSEPVRNRGSGTWTIYLARKVVDHQGNFIGLVLGAIELEYFEKLFGAIVINPQSSISLFRRDGMLLARYPHVDGVVGRQYGSNAMFRTSLVHADRGVGRQAGVIDGKARLIASHAVPHFPIVISATTTIDAALADWQREVKILAGSGALIALLIGVVIVLIARPLLRGQERSQQALRRQKVQLDTALNNMHQGLLMFDLEGRLILHNKRFLQMYDLISLEAGYTLSDILRLRKKAGNFDGDPEQYADRVLNEIGKLAKSPNSISVVDEDSFYVQERELSDGRTISIINRTVPGVGWVSTHEDVTEQRRAERERDRNQAFLDLVIENVPTIIVVKDPRDLRYVLINQAGEEYYGIARDKMIGKTVHEVLPKETADYITKLERELLRGDRRISVNEHTLETPGNGTRVAKSTKLLVFDGREKPEYLLSVIEDITEQRTVERQLLQAQKMEAIGNLTGGLAHDFNNLLTVIIGNLDLLQEEIIDNVSVQQKIELILQASTHGAELTRQMLAFSRRQSLHPCRINLNELVRKTTRLLRRTLGESIAINLRLEDNLWPVHADAAQLEAVLLNIAINARDAMPEGGSLVIETHKAHLDDDCAADHLEVISGDYIVIEITDTGTGMSSEVLSRVFDPFFTTKGPDKGSGLGLSMAYGFIKQSRGHISVYSELGKGTTFKLYLPSAGNSEADLPVTSASEELSKVASSEVVLVVDDNSEVRSTAVKLLKEFGYQVLEASNGRIALEMLDAAPRVDLLFTDLIMPGGMDGKELANQAQSERPNLKVLFTSGFPGAALTNGAALDVDAPFLSKPYRKHDLAKAVGNILGQSW